MNRREMDGMRKKIVAAALLLVASLGAGYETIVAHDGVATRGKSNRLYMELSDRQCAFLAATRAERERTIADAGAREALASGSRCAVDGVTNFRDLGGLRGYGGKSVRKGILFRSGRFDMISPFGRELLVKELGIRTDLDLRGEVETSGLNGVSPLGTNVYWRLVPLLAYDAIESTEGRKWMKEALDVVFDRRNWPVAFHCKTGKDRTGTLAFVILALLGVSEDDICLDWEVTAFYVPELSRMNHVGRYDRLLSYILRLPGADLCEKVENYVLSLGFSVEAVESFRRDMLEVAVVSICDCVAADVS